MNSTNSKSTTKTRPSGTRGRTTRSRSSIEASPARAAGRASAGAAAGEGATPRGTLPTPLPEAIDWVAQHLPRWIAAGKAIGLEDAQLEDLKAMLAQAAALKHEWRSLKTRATAKGVEYRASATAMRSIACSQLTRIHGFAHMQDDPNAVLVAAGLASPAGPAPTPGMARDFEAHPLEGGAVRFSFESDHPEGLEGVTYRIARQLDPRTPGELLLSTAARTFTDHDPPAGVATYMVTAQTPEADGNPSYFTVHFGGEDGAAIIAQWPALERFADQARARVA